VRDSNGQKSPEKQARSDTQVQGAWLHPMPPLRAVAGGVSQVHAVSHLST
jgi:hypothetical protein